MMVSLNNAFAFHLVINALFCAPAFLFGLKGFVELMSEGTVTDPDAWLIAVLGVDFVKNLMIGVQTYAAMSFGKAEQRSMAWIMVALCAGCALNLFINPTGPTPPPPAVVYLTTVPAVYIYALVKGDEKAKSK